MSSHSISKTPSCSHRSPRRSGGTPHRVFNPWIIFRKDAYTDGTTVVESPRNQRAALISRMWREASPEVREIYKKKALEQKLKYQKKFLNLKNVGDRYRSMRAAASSHETNEPQPVTGDVEMTPVPSFSELIPVVASPLASDPSITSSSTQLPPDTLLFDNVPPLSAAEGAEFDRLLSLWISEEARLYELGIEWSEPQQSFEPSGALPNDNPEPYPFFFMEEPYTTPFGPNHQIFMDSDGMYVQIENGVGI